jgi:peptidoglycan/xylan/chitin deacetylase (PgdA/CDA1 family)
MDITFSFYPGGKKKALTMSYDDGQIHDRRLVDIFNKYGIKGSFHLNSGKFDSGPYINASEVAELYRGHEISAHTYNHPHLTLVPNGMIVSEILEDRKKLESLAGYPVRGMSYPFGVYNDEVTVLLPGLGIEYSRTVESHGRFCLPDNFLKWHPTCHHNDGLMDKCRNFQNQPSWAQMPLFYIWGHSYEFDRDNNWELMEEFCKTVCDDDNVWYATNIEILDYVKAMRGLKFSADRRIVQNTSALPVWIGVDGEAYKIEAGKVVSI